MCLWKRLKRLSREGPNKALLKEALDYACHFFHFTLLHTEEGHEALHYLYGRGLDLEFIRYFRIGLAPKRPGVLRKVMQAKNIRDDVLMDAGLISSTKDGQWRDFFSGRIMFPIHHHTGRRHRVFRQKIS